MLAAATVIRRGGLVIIPTDTLYGLAVDARNVEAVRRVFQVKGRGGEKALPLIAADIEQVESTFGRLPTLAAALAARFWPGPLTLLLRRPPEIPTLVTGDLDTVGVRVPNHAVARALCRTSGALLTATSANVSGEQPSGNPDDVARALGAHVDLLLDDGPTPGGLPSTIVDVSGDAARLVRAGAIPWEKIEACLATASDIP